MPATALRHFNEDMSRAKAIVAHGNLILAATPEERLLRTDLFRSAWMFAVGGMDAYFCDAYADVVAATLISKSRQPAITLPDFVDGIRLPVRAILESYSTNLNWRWRMAARQIMERENVLSLETVQTLFNKFFRVEFRFFGDLLDAWIVHPDAKKAVFAIRGDVFASLSSADKERARKAARQSLQDRFGEIIQRRHDCIHNCDRPKMAPQPLGGANTVSNVIRDVEFLVRRCDEHIHAEFREFLLSIDCTSTTIAQVGY